MFKVLFPPFSPDLGLTPNITATLAYVGARKTRILVSNIATDPDVSARLLFRIETTAECLNSSLGLDFVREMLRSIQYTIGHGEEIRRRERLGVPGYMRRQAPFAPNNDWGQGGSGVDGYW